MAVLLLAATAAPAMAQDVRPFTTDDLCAMKRVGAPVLSPDGKWVAYVISICDFDENKYNSDIWLVPAEGGESRQLTNSEKGDSYPVWAPDGKTLAFRSSRGGDGGQIWLLPMDGGEAQRLTEFPGGIDDFVWTPDGQYIVFAARTYLECGGHTDCIEEKDDEKEEDKVKAMVHEHLMYRHWNTYEDGKTQHLFIIPADGSEGPVDLTPDLKFDALTYWLASAGLEFDVSPDGKYIYFAGNQDEDQAVSYNMEVYRVPTAGGEIEKLTDNPAADSHPRVSPDGKWLAYRATRRPYYESDKYELTLMNLKTREIRSLTEDVDLSVGPFYWSDNGKTLYFEAEDRADANLFSVSAKGGKTQTVIGGDGPTGRGYHFNCEAGPKEKFFVYRYRPIDHYYEIFRCDGKGRNVKQLTFVNQDLMDEVYRPKGEEIWFEGAGGTPVHGFLLKPIDFDPNRKYPMMVRVHGGPQQMFGYAIRFEYLLFTGAEYVVFFCNPRGSTGYGQEFTDGIRGDWDGKVIEDLRLGVRHVVDNYSFVDRDRIGAWGGSFGGFVCNWFQGHNDGWDGKDIFGCLVSHAGDAEQWSGYGSTEELWFPEWETFGPPWENPEGYDKTSPIRYAKNFRTPMLITHGELDYRVPITGGEQMFTALQRLGVPSKMIRFPDEDHWIQKPQNRAFWYGSIVDWFDQWLKRGGKPKEE
jgi:dipeptidyl aminopeptidase/acylaminoacyl peptidase